MAQLLNISTSNYEAVRISGGGKFVPSEKIETERQHAIQRGIAEARSANLESRAFSNEINRSYQRVSASADLQKELGSLEERRISQPAVSVPEAAAAPAPSSTAVPASSEAAVGSTPTDSTSVSAGDLSQENHANYYQELGSLEMRVQRGDLSFVPPLQMTIVTQKPEIHIEYTGDFNYFPKVEETGSTINTES